MSDTPPSDEITAQLRERVEERRRDGLYPPGLEDDLDLHFHHIVIRGVRDRFERLRAALEQADAAGRTLSADAIPVDSDRPGGRLVHRLVSAIVRRQVDGALTQVREYADALAEAHRALLLAHADLISHVDDLRDRLEEASGGRPSE